MADVFTFNFEALPETFNDRDINEGYIRQHNYKLGHVNNSEP
jgi:hypothetical protein